MAQDTPEVLVIKLKGESALQLRALAEKEHRTPTAQVRHMLSQLLVETSIYMDSAEPTVTGAGA